MDSHLSSPAFKAFAAGLAIATGLGVALGVIGPFGSYLNAGPLARIGYWTVNLWGGWLLFGLAMPALARRARARGWPLWAWAPPAVALLTVAPTATSRLMAVSLWPVTAGVGALEWYGQSLIVSALATTLVLWQAGAFGRADPAASGFAVSESADPRDRLPPALGRRILCLQMEDHYVRVHTPQGSALVLMSLSQAMAGLVGLEGLRTHRSWWVAREAVESVARDGRNLRLKLSGGLEAPVARAQVGALRAAGWLGD